MSFASVESALLSDLVAYHGYLMNLHTLEEDGWGDVEAIGNIVHIEAPLVGDELRRYGYGGGITEGTNSHSGIPCAK